jgi:hypothetical protein
MTSNKSNIHLLLIQVEFVLPQTATAGAPHSLIMLFIKCTGTLPHIELCCHINGNTDMKKYDITCQFPVMMYIPKVP